MRLSVLSILSLCAGTTAAFSLSMQANDKLSAPSDRRAFMSAATTSVAALGAFAATQPANAAPQIYQTSSGVKYAVLKESSKGGFPQPGDIVAIEYTGYLVDGKIFDGTHSEGKQNALLFKLGNSAIVPGISDMVAEMKVGQKVQAIVPPQLAFGEKGVCLEDGDCLVKPGSTLVYDILLKKSSIPPP